jgi:hypothetical protein
MLMLSEWLSAEVASVTSTLVAMTKRHQHAVALKGAVVVVVGANLIELRRQATTRQMWSM